MSTSLLRQPAVPFGELTKALDKIDISQGHAEFMQSALLSAALVRSQGLIALLSGHAKLPLAKQGTGVINAIDAIRFTPHATLFAINTISLSLRSVLLSAP